MTGPIAIDPDELRVHSESLRSIGDRIADAADRVRGSTAGIAPGGAGGLDSDEINRKYFEAAQGLLDATQSVGELLTSVGDDIGQFAEVSEQLEAARTLANLEQDPYPANGDVKLWTRSGSVLGGGGGVSGPVIVH